MIKRVSVADLGGSLNQYQSGCEEAEPPGDRFGFLRQTAAFASFELVPITQGNAALDRCPFMVEAVGHAKLF